MNPAAQRVRDIFVAAVKLPPDQREAFLKQACAGDEALNRQVRELQSGSPAPVPKARRGISSGPSGLPDAEVSAHRENPD